MISNISLRIYLISFNYSLLNELLKKIKKFCIEFNLNFKGPVYLPTKKERFDILKSPHVNKKSRDQLQISTYKRFIDFFDIKKEHIDHLKSIFLYFSLDFFFKILK